MFYNCFCGLSSLPALVSQPLRSAQCQQHQPKGAVHHADDQCNPAGVCVWPINSHAAKNRQRCRARHRTHQENPEAGAEQRARAVVGARCNSSRYSRWFGSYVHRRLHRFQTLQRHPASMAYTTTPVTETYSQMGNVKRAILLCCGNRPLNEK